MMIHAYPETYLNNAMGVMGDAFDYAVNDCRIAGDIFVKLFLASRICTGIENGEPMYLLGKSGVEIVHDILNDTMGAMPDTVSAPAYNRSPEYWCGWAVCYYQWLTSRKYADIFRAVSWDDLLVMYPTLHEADISQFAERLDRLVLQSMPETNLKRFRAQYNYSQSTLAKQSGVSLRSIQMFEQRNKDINKAQSETLFRLSKALGCHMEDLLEPPTISTDMSLNA